MIRFFLFLALFTALLRLQAQFAIVDENGQATSEVTIIAGVAVQLNSNFETVRGNEVVFPQNHRTSSDVAYDIGFSFEFFQEVFDQYFIGANGYITFENPPRNPAPVLTGIPFNSNDPQYPRNSIFGAFKGWEAEGGNYVTRLNTGSPSDRSLVVTWCDIPAMQSDSSGTFQIVLHENGEIDIHLINIPFSNYAGNNTGSGIQSRDAFAGLAVPGRDYGPWPPAASESWRFTWEGSDYSVQNIPYSPVAVAEHIDWYEIEGPGSRRWLGNNRQVLVNPRQTTTYQAELTSCWGETITSAEIRVVVEGVFPNAFSPNSTVLSNQTFKMPDVSNAVVSNFKLQVYNRWGQLVFETADHNQGWNGLMQNHGKECPAGVYHWILLVEENGKSPVTNSGAVMLLR